MGLSSWTDFYARILELEQRGLVTRTFRRLDPERQELILQAILDEAVDKGLVTLSIKDVAARAGVAVGSLYQYFGNRDGLVDFAIELCVAFTAGVFDEYRDYLVHLPLREGLAAYLIGGVEWGQTEISLVRLFARAAYQGDPAFQERLVQPVALVMRHMVSDILAAAQARGELRPDVDLEALTRVIHALMIAVGDAQLLPYLNTYFQVVDAEMPPERLLEGLLDLVLHGIASGGDRQEGA